MGESDKWDDFGRELTVKISSMLQESGAQMESLVKDEEERVMIFATMIKAVFSVLMSMKLALSEEDQRIFDEQLIQSINKPKVIVPE